MAKKKKGAATPPPIPKQSDRGSDALSPKKIKELRTEMSGNKIQLEQTQALAEKFRLEARKASIELESQLNQVSDLEAEIKTLSQENFLLRGTLEKELKKNKTLIAELAAASDQLQRCNTSWKASQKRVAELESQLKKARSLNQASLASARESGEAEETAKARIGQLESQLSKVTHTLAGVGDELETARRALKEEVARSRSLQAQLESAEGEQGNPVLLAQIQELESQLANLNKTFSDHMASCRDDQFPALLVRCNAAEDKVNELREELRKSKNTAAAAAVAQEEFMSEKTLPQAPPVEKATPEPRGSRGWIVAVVIGILILITMAFFACHSVLSTYIEGEDRGIHLFKKGMDLKRCCKTEAVQAEVGQPARPTKTKTQPPRTRVRGAKKKRVKAPRQQNSAGQPVGSLSSLDFPADEDDHSSGDAKSQDEFFTSSTQSGSNSPTEFGNDPELGLSAPADVAPRAVTVTPRTKKCKGGCLRKKAIRECMKLGHTRAECRSVIS